MYAQKNMHQHILLFCWVHDVFNLSHQQLVPVLNCNKEAGEICSCYQTHWRNIHQVTHSFEIQPFMLLFGKSTIWQEELEGLRGITPGPSVMSSPDRFIASIRFQKWMSYILQTDRTPTSSMSYASLATKVMARLADG